MNRSEDIVDFHKTQQHASDRMQSQWPDIEYGGVAVTDEDFKTLGRTVQVQVPLEIDGD